MNKSNPAGSVTGSDIIDAKIEEHQLCGSKKCPSCGHKLEGKPVSNIPFFFFYLISVHLKNKFFLPSFSHF